jgi:hypothetical protein
MRLVSFLKRWLVMLSTPSFDDDRSMSKTRTSARCAEKAVGMRRGGPNECPRPDSGLVMTPTSSRAVLGVEPSGQRTIPRSGKRLASPCG